MPILPSELQREIFEIALRFDLRDTALMLNLSLVARRVQFWVGLFFYKTVKIRSEKSADKFLALIAKKPPGFFAVAVQKLCIVYGVPAPQTLAILSECTGVTQLACFTNIWMEDSPEHPLLSRPALNQLWIEYNHFMEISAAPSTGHSNLTHLYLLISDRALPSDISSLTKILNRLPRLRHVSLDLTPSTANKGHVETIRASFPNLRVVAGGINYTDIPGFIVI
ncbi:hypothetical protein B0H11DRAFT_31879 [Mycena galericulata]|nr:hypothetical protein B0H11DRAFT_31879 [Mycena galericulata]